MKKFLAIFLSLVMILALAACGNSDKKDEEEKDKTTASSDETTTAAAEDKGNATNVPAPEGEKVSYHGVSIVIPTGLSKKEAEDDEEEDAIAYADADDNYIELSYVAADASEWDNAKATLSSEMTEGVAEMGFNMTDQELTISGKNAYRVTVSGTFAEREMYMSMTLIQLADGICNVTAAGAEPTLNAALDAAVQNITVD